MNDSQNKKYWRRWDYVCSVNSWRFPKGRILSEAVRSGNIHVVSVWRLAETLAEQACRAVTADDLRHACHIHAFGRDIGHASFTNTQFSRLLLLWGDERKIKGLLISAEDLQAQMDWDDAERAIKRSLVLAIRAAAKEEYITAITKDVWGTIYWEELDVEALRGLLRKLKGNHPS